MNASNWLVGIALAGVAVVLIAGLVNMMRGGSGSTSQTLMRWRVVLQFAAVVLIMTVVWLQGR